MSPKEAGRSPARRLADDQATAALKHWLVSQFMNRHNRRWALATSSVDSCRPRNCESVSRGDRTCRGRVLAKRNVASRTRVVGNGFGDVESRVFAAHIVGPDFAFGDDAGNR